MANLLCTDTELQTVANAIRSKGNTSAALGFPTGMKNAIDALNVGANLSPAAAAGDIRNGKKAVVNRQTITGSMSEKAAATYNTSSSDQSIAANQYLTGAQTIKAVTTSNLSAGNIKSGVVVKVGDANSAGRIANITGTYKSTAVTTTTEKTYTKSMSFSLPAGDVGRRSGGSVKVPRDDNEYIYKAEAIGVSITGSAEIIVWVRNGGPATGIMGNIDVELANSDTGACSGSITGIRYWTAKGTVTV